MEQKRTYRIWVAITLFVMLLLPLMVAKLASDCAGMALCILLLYVINPLYSVIIGIVSGGNIKSLWHLPLIAAVAFLAGVWLFFDIHELWFIAYAAVYLCLGTTSMLITHSVK